MTHRFTTSIYIWFAKWEDTEVWGAILIPPWVKGGANLTCTLRYMKFATLERLKIPTPRHLM
jgi:hypothetical protein